MTAEQIQVVNEFACCGGIIAGTIFWVFFADVIFAKR